MHLEDLRYDDLGQTYFWISKFGNESINSSNAVAMTYVEYANHAFYRTCQAIEDLENTSGLPGSDKLCLTTVSLWFLSFEAYISNILKTVCLFNSQNYDSYTKKDINEKLSAIFSYTNIDRIAFQKSGLFPKIQEFKQLRNSIFHDSFVSSNCKCKHTLFSKIPIYVNLIDVFKHSLFA